MDDASDEAFSLEFRRVFFCAKRWCVIPFQNSVAQRLFISFAHSQQSKSLLYAKRNAPVPHDPG